MELVLFSEKHLQSLSSSRFLGAFFHYSNLQSRWELSHEHRSIRYGSEGLYDHNFNTLRSQNSGSSLNVQMDSGKKGSGREKLARAFL